MGYSDEETRKDDDVCLEDITTQVEFEDAEIHGHTKEEGTWKRGRKMKLFLTPPLGARTKKRNPHRRLKSNKKE